MIDLDNPVMASEEEIAQLRIEDLKAVCSKSADSSWVATAYVETEDKIIVCAISYGKNPKKVLRQVLSKAMAQFPKETTKC